MMTQVNTRRSLAVETIVQSLENSKLCVIPSDMVRVIFEDSMNLQAKANEINDNIAKTLDMLVKMNVNNTTEFQ